ncbi:ribulose-1,5-biphosphate synthetase [compost metagenome]
MFNRRKFLKLSAVAAITPTIGAVASPIDTTNNTVLANGTTIKEPQKDIPIVREAEVIVCGGGPAGIAAAISAGRKGAKTILIEAYGCLGGVWTTGLLCNIIDYQNKGGIMQEIVKRLQETDAQYSAKCYDPELMKVLLDEMCREAGVEIRLHTRITAAYRNKKNKIEHIVTESFSGREAWKGKIFIDATGNGDLSAYAGCKFDIGSPENGKTQPASLMAIIGGLNEEEMVKNGYMMNKGLTSEDAKKKLYKTIKETNLEPSFTKPTFFGIRPGLVALMTNHEYEVSALDASQISRATINARKEIYSIVDGLRKKGGIWSQMRVLTTGAQIGIREARRIHGLYRLTSEDLINGARFDDAVCRVTFTVDIHTLTKAEGGAYHNGKVKVKPYDIPLRSLIAKDVNGLMMVGRCISGDFYAHGSYRVTGNAVTMGENAGIVAAAAAKTDRLPQDVPWNEFGIQKNQ